MKKIFLAVLVLTTVGVLALWSTGPSSNGVTNSSSSSSNSGESPAVGSNDGNSSKGSSVGNQDALPDDVDNGLVDPQSRPATELYKDAEEALRAVKEGAKNYDDLIVEQFTQLGPNCTWCDPFYKSLRDLAFSADTSAEQRSFYAELLAVSGRVDNVESLVTQIESAPSQDAAQTFSEALEIAVGGDDVVSFLGGRLLSTPNAPLKESIVAAISNQGSPLAVNTLYKYTVESGNPDGLYSQGTGLGEVIPNAESIPVLKSMVEKQDDYSHLPAKTLLNGGTEGLKSLVETLSASTDPDKVRKILKDSYDHLNIDDQSERYLRDVVAKSPNSAIAEFGNQALKNIQQQQEAIDQGSDDTDDDDTGSDETPVPTQELQPDE
jgi:hypothetical protein